MLKPLREKKFETFVVAGGRGGRGLKVVAKYGIKLVIDYINEVLKIAQKPSLFFWYSRNISNYEQLPTLSAAECDHFLIPLTNS